MRKDWEMKKLNEICEVRPSKRQVKNVISEEELVTYTPMRDLGIAKKYFSGNEEKAMGDAYKGYTYFEEGDVILAKITPCFENGKLGIAKNLTNGIGFGSTEFIPYRTKDKILPEYLYYYLNHPSFRLEGERLMTGAVGHKRLPKDFYEEHKIPLPPLEEQKRIVAILDEAFEAIGRAEANIEQNIANAEELFESKLNRIFKSNEVGWDHNTLGETCKISMGQSPKSSTYNDEGIGTPLINGPVEFGPKPFSITIKSKWTTAPNKMCKKGDLILCVRGSTTGRINIAGFDACIGRGVASMRYSKNQKWLNYFIRANQEFIFNLGSGSTFPNVSGKNLKKINFPEPPVGVQRDFISTMDSMLIETNKLLRNLKSKLNNLSLLKKSILQQAFSGALTGPESGFAGLSDEQDRAVHKAAEPEQAYEVE